MSQPKLRGRSGGKGRRRVEDRTHTHTMQCERRPCLSLFTFLIFSTTNYWKVNLRLKERVAVLGSLRGIFARVTHSPPLPGSDQVTSKSVNGSKVVCSLAPSPKRWVTGR